MVSLADQMKDSTVFFLVKGHYQPDSRLHLGLMHKIEASPDKVVIKAGELAQLQVTIENTGSAKWLHENVRDIGVVRLAVHLYDDNLKLLAEGFYRLGLGSDILPGQKIRMDVAVPIAASTGRCILALDLVSEQVTWFEKVGAKPKLIDVIIDHLDYEN